MLASGSFPEVWAVHMSDEAQSALFDLIPGLRDQADNASGWQFKFACNFGVMFESPSNEGHRRISDRRSARLSTSSASSSPSRSGAFGRYTEDLQSALLIESCASGGVEIPAISSGWHGMVETRHSESRDRPGLVRLSAPKQTQIPNGFLLSVKPGSAYRLAKSACSHR
jgi:hypothetical protein